MVYESDKLLLQLNFNGLEVVDKIDLYKNRGMYLQTIRNVIFEAFKHDQEFLKLVPTPDKWNQIAMYKDVTWGGRNLILTESQMEAAVIYHVRKYHRDRDEHDDEPWVPLQLWFGDKAKIQAQVRDHNLKRGIRN